MTRLAKTLGLITTLLLLLSTLGVGITWALERDKRVSIVKSSVEILPLKVEGGLSTSRGQAREQSLIRRG